MKVRSVEVLDVGALAILRRDARRKRREDSKLAGKKTIIEALYQDLSSLSVPADLRQDNSAMESPLPPVAEDQVGKYEEPDAVALLLFARASGGKPVLVEFDVEPSKAYEERLRQAAKVRSFTLHFYRLTDRWAAVEVHPKETPDASDASVLRSLGVRW